MKKEKRPYSNQYNRFCVKCDGWKIHSNGRLYWVCLTCGLRTLKIKPSVLSLLVLLALQLACLTSAIGQPTMNAARATSADLSAVPAVYEVVATPMSVGNVTADVLHVRAGHALTAEGVGYLYFNDPVLEMDCFTEDGITWVKHQTGWSVVRNKTVEYIAGVCDGE